LLRLPPPASAASLLKWPLLIATCFSSFLAQISSDYLRLLQLLPCSDELSLPPPPSAVSLLGWFFNPKDEDSMLVGDIALFLSKYYYNLEESTFYLIVFCWVLTVYKYMTNKILRFEWEACLHFRAQHISCFFESTF
jgi:hypothetical protein